MRFSRTALSFRYSLTLPGDLSEVCQYCIYFSGVATKEQFPTHHRTNTLCVILSVSERMV